jgi:GTPase SAR1 family protein
MFNHSLLSSSEDISDSANVSALCETRNGVSYTLWKSSFIEESKEKWYSESLQLNDNIPVCTVEEKIPEAPEDPLSEFINR